MKYRLTHTTTYEYDCLVSHGRHVIRKRPRNLVHQSIVRTSLQTEPRPSWATSTRDYFQNDVDTVEVIEPHDRFVVKALSELEVLSRPLDLSSPGLRKPWESIREQLERDPTAFPAREMMFDSPLIRRTSALLKYATPSFPSGRPLIEAIVDLNARIHRDFAYDPHATDIATPLDQVMAQRRGVCQDFAHVAVGALRAMGLAGRYVSGYLETMPPPGTPRLVGADASHAWASVYFPDEGWIAFDPTNNLLPSEQHIVVAWGRDFSDVSPLRGVVLGGGRHTVSVGVDVVRVGTESIPPAPEQK